MIKGVNHKVHHSGYGEEVHEKSDTGGGDASKKKKKMTSPIQKNFYPFFLQLSFCSAVSHRTVNYSKQ